MSTEISATGRPSTIERARLYLEKVPAAVAGSGGHNQTFTAACALVKGFGLSVDEARPLLSAWNAGCQPPWTERELEHKLASAERSPDTRPRGWLLGADATGNDGNRGSPRPGEALPRRPAQAAPAWTFDPAKLATFAAPCRERVSLPWLADRSPVEPAAVDAAGFLAKLYQPAAGENVVIFTEQASQGQALWPREQPPAGAPEGVWFLAQPTDGRTRYNPRTGRSSRRSEESVTSWRFLVMESDEAPARDWLGALVQLPLRIAALYTSGGRSIHALVRVDAPDKAAWDRERDALRPALVTLGADPASLSAVRLTRLPGCRRGGRLQRLLYLNPEPGTAPLCELRPVREDSAGAWLRWHDALTATHTEALAAVLDSPDDAPHPPPSLLAALAFYSPADARCRAARDHWRSLASGESSHVETAS